MEADGGTLFLDELGEMPAEVQPKLLRALESGEVLPLGGARPRRVDVRLVAATNRVLMGEVGAGRFREDLYARLAGVVLRPPPLKDRRGDVVKLFRRFLSDGVRRRPLTADFAEALLLYAWPATCGS